MRSNHGVSRKYWTNLDWPRPARGNLNYRLHHAALKCLRQLLVIRWQAYDRVRYDEILQRTGLTSLSHLSSRRRISVFRHVARLDDYTPANMAVQLHINVPLNRPPGLWRQREFKVGGTNHRMGWGVGGEHPSPHPNTFGGSVERVWEGGSAPPPPNLLFYDLDILISIFWCILRC